jgi:hypothetical protein
VEALKASSSRKLRNLVAIDQLITDAYHISSLLQDVCGFRAFGRGGGREAITTPRNIDYETVAVLPILECPTQGGNVDGKVGRYYEYPWPNARHQLVLADQPARALGQGDQNIEGATAKSDLFIAFEQQALKG